VQADRRVQAASSVGCVLDGEVANFPSLRSVFESRSQWAFMWFGGYCILDHQIRPDLARSGQIEELQADIVARLRMHGSAEHVLGAYH